MKVYTGILVLCALYLTILVDQNLSYYSNEAGICYNYSYYISCNIYINDTQAIKSLLTIGSQGSQYRLYVHKQYGFDKGSVTLDIEIPSNIRYMSLYLSRYNSHEQIILRASSVNTNLVYMYCDVHVILESQNFFNQFVGLIHIYFSYLQSTTWPSFSELVNLRYFEARILIGGNQALNSSFLTDLSKLHYLSLRYSGFTSIMDGTFENMDSLYYLYLDHNRVSSLQDGALRGLTYLKELSLEDNGLRDVSHNAFRDLVQLAYLNLNENPDLPLVALIPLKNIRTLYLNFNNYHTIDPYVFQQMNRLEILYINNPLTCDCNLEWVSVLKQYGVQIRYSYCLDPPSASGRSIVNKDSYTNCTQTQSYKCFDKSVTCENNEVCHNTGSSYYCGCPIGYELNSISHCGDINECDEINLCQQSCVNTDGTFHCACSEGYKLTDNGYDCEDINECQGGNGDCEYGCKNTMGSYQCYCEVGQRLYNRTNCNNDFQCELIGDTYDPFDCVDRSEKILNCNSGFNFSVTNLPCVQTATIATTKAIATTTKTTTYELSTDTQQATIASFLENYEWVNPTLILLIITFIIVAIQTVVIVILIVCILKKSKGSKNNNPTQPIDSRSLPNIPTSQSKYGVFHDSDEIESPEKVYPPANGSGNQSDMLTAMSFPEPYPAEGTVYFNLS